MIKIVPEKHLKAWLLTQENLTNDSPEELKKVEQTEVVDKMMDLIQKVPLDAYNAIKTVAKDAEHMNNVKTLLLEYRKQFQETVDFLNSREKTVHPNIKEAIMYIDNQFGYWAGNFES
jgi:hypothetical protein